MNILCTNLFCFLRTFNTFCKLHSRSSQKSLHYDTPPFLPPYIKMSGVYVLYCMVAYNYGYCSSLVVSVVLRSVDGVEGMETIRRRGEMNIPFMQAERRWMCSQGTPACNACAGTQAHRTQAQGRKRMKRKRSNKINNFTCMYG